ncbi:acyl carrier protein TtuC [Teredinibacter turnerae]|uniref:Acyl carrier protein TtuC n=1 Tax=Teredinibacter turnerae (strain ATCC 39867 / T7901) TaxID=377629 RepID=TTUC_TERTT|nr:acyl carrier protein [Teredinibacter turnerae]ACR12812.1 acyl carrier protein [Teredinibacter turnerae T7901]
MTTVETLEPTITAEDVQQWLAEYIADVLEISESAIDFDTPFHQFGLDSSAVVGLVADLSEWSGVAIGIKSIRKNNSIHALSQFIAAK